MRGSASQPFLNREVGLPPADKANISCFASAGSRRSSRPSGYSRGTFHSNPVTTHVPMIMSIFFRQARRAEIFIAWATPQVINIPLSLALPRNGGGWRWVYLSTQGFALGYNNIAPLRGEMRNDHRDLPSNCIITAVTFMFQALPVSGAQLLLSNYLSAY